MPAETLSLFLDIQTTQNPPPHSWRGIPRYVVGQAGALSREPGVVRRLALNPLLPFPSSLDPELLTSPALTWSTTQVFRRACSEGPMAYYVMSPFELVPLSESVLPPYVSRADVPLIVTLYDLIPLLRPQHYLPEPIWASKYYVRLEMIKNADLVLAISEHTRQDGIDLLGLDPAKVKTIGAGVSPYFRIPDRGTNPRAIVSSALPVIHRPFILAVQGAEERKNTERLIQAYGLIPRPLRSQLQLVIACQLNEEYSTSWRRLAAESGLGEDEMVLTDLVSDRTLRALYQSAELFIFPSLYEGFGLPAAEAAACGCAVLTSNTSSLPEVLDFPAATFDPTDCDSMAAAMQRGICDSRFAHKLRLAARAATPRHSWSQVAKRTRQAVDELSLATSSGGFPIPSARARLAIAGCFSPASSAFASYNLDLIQELSSRVDVDLFSTGPLDAVGANSDRPFRLFPATSLLRSINPTAYDAIIYSFDGGADDGILENIARARPGWAWLHGESADHARAKSILHSVPNLHGIFVDSELAQRVVELSKGMTAAGPAVFTLRLSAGPARAVWRAGSRPRILALAPRQLEAGKILIDAAADIARWTPLRLTFWGNAPADIHDGLVSHALACGILSSVTFLAEGREFDEVPSEASVAIEIQTADSVRSSPDLLAFLCAGIPVVTNLLSCREFPQGAVELLPSYLTSRTVTGALRKVLNNEHVAHDLHLKGLSFTRDATMQRLADRLLPFLLWEEPGDLVELPMFDSGQRVP